MAETLVKEKICTACGTEVRPQAMFCYNCGSAVAPDIPLGKTNNKKVSDAWLRDNLVDEDSKEIEFEAREKDHEIIIDKNESASEEVVDEKISEEKTNDEVVEDEKAEKRDLSKMQSAASLRRRGKSIQKKRVEVVWEEHESAPNGWFIFFAIIFTALAVAIWIISTYLE